MRRLTIATLALAATISAMSVCVQAQEPASAPSLSDRLWSLQRRWAREEEQQQSVKPVQHVDQSVAKPRPRHAYGPINQQPPRRSQGGLLSGDLFSALRGDDEPESEPTSAEIHLADAGRQRAGSAFNKPAPPASDIGTALGAPPLRQPTPAVESSKPAPPVSPAPGRRPYTSGDVSLDLISSSADSSATRSTAAKAQAPRVALNSQTESESSQGQGYATAADAARAMAGHDLASTMAVAPPTTGSPSDIPAVVTPLFDSQKNRDRQPATASVTTDRYAQADSQSLVTKPAEAEPAEVELDTQPVTPIETEAVAEMPSPTIESSTSTTELQPNWESVNSNPMRSSVRDTPPAAASSPGSTRDVLVEKPLPLVMTQVTGPSEILIGREATYRVTVQNRGGAATEGLIADISIPDWADVLHSKSTTGTVRHGGVGTAGTQLQWDLPAVAAAASEVLEISLVPKSSQPLELGVTWRQAPIASTTHVVVQEPKLAVAISGPDEVFFGRPQTYRLTISNPGTGIAEKVVVELMPPGGSTAVSSHRLEKINPGEAKVVEVEVTAREAGELAVRAIATSEGGLRADATQPIFCRKPELQIDWRGPGRKFAGTEGTYFFRVRNPGTAPADQVEFEVALPAGFELVSASDGHRRDDAGRRVLWKIGTLRPGDDCYLEMRGVLNQPGQNSLVLSAATVGGDISHTGTAATEVVALADLKLEVADPKGPVPVGKEIDYEIIVTNRGRSAAEDVKIAGFFSAGVEPLAVEGGEAQISDGRVSLRPVESLPAGQQVRIKIRAKAQTAGTHLFRAEVLCRDSEIKLASEETTRYYSDETAQSSNDYGHDSAAMESRFQQVR